MKLKQGPATCARKDPTESLMSIKTGPPGHQREEMAAEHLRRHVERRTLEEEATQDNVVEMEMIEFPVSHLFFLSRRRLYDIEALGSCTITLAHSLTHSLTHSPAPSASSLTHSLTNSPTH